MTVRLVAAFTVLVLLSSCALENIPKDYALNARSAQGIATGTITYEGDYAAYILHVVNTKTGDEYRIQHGSAQTLNPFLAFGGESRNPDLGVLGSAFAVALPAGTYKIASWQISQGAANVWSTAPIPITFTIKAGASIYLGNYHFRETDRYGRAISAATLTVTSKYERDHPILLKLFPTLATSPLSSSIRRGTDMEDVGGNSSGRIEVPIFVPTLSR